MAALHISEAEAVRDFAGVLAKLDAGTEVVVDRESRPALLLRAADEPIRLLSEALRMAKERDSAPTLDASFSENLQAAIDSHREPLNTPWE